MGKKIIKEGWLYEYEEKAKYRINGYEVTGVRYVLGEQFNTSCKKTLICIGINPSTAVPGNRGLDNTVRNVQKYAKSSREYGAWYMLNVYPQRATNPDDMDIEPNMEIHRNNLAAIKTCYPKSRKQMYGALGAISSERENICMTCCLETQKKELMVLLVFSIQTITLRHTILPLRVVLNTLL